MHTGERYLHDDLLPATERGTLASVRVCSGKLFTIGRALKTIVLTVAGRDLAHLDGGGPMLRRGAPVVALLCLLATPLAAAHATADEPGARRTALSAAAGEPLVAAASGHTHVGSRPASGRTVVATRHGRTATFTVGARTVTITGPSRTFSESTTSATVTSTMWVRLLPAPFSGTIPETWLSAALADRSPDLLATAMQYTTGARTILDGQGAVLADDADYGPLQEDGTREEGSDFNDYLGITWTYESGVDEPEADQIGALDCSGFVRMVVGRRLGIPLTLDPDGLALPRRSVQMAASAPGVVVVSDTGTRATDTSALRPGDLVFFDVSTNDGSDIDHVGIYLGKDSAGVPRFVSSRKTANGPTMGDTGGRSTLSGTGFYASGWRSARRL